MTDRALSMLKYTFLSIALLLSIYFIGLIIVIKFFMLMIAVLFIIRKTNKHYYRTIEVNGMRLCIMFFMMIVSIIALILSTYIVMFFVDFLGINIAVVKWFSLFDKDKNIVSANSIFVFITMVFLPAYYIYNFLQIVNSSLFERWFGKNQIFRDVTRCYDEKIFLAYFTIITVFMGFLPMFVGEMIAVKEAKNTIDSLSLTFLLMSLLPTSHLLIKQAKR